MDRYGYGDGKPGNPSVGYVATTQLKDIKKRLPLRVLSAERLGALDDLGLCGREERDPGSEHPPARPTCCGRSRRWTRATRRAGTSRSCATTR